jgi:hypothetical protein
VWDSVAAKVPCDADTWAGQLKIVRCPGKESGEMAPDNEYRQELLEKFGKTVANWKNIGQKTADPALAGEHKTWLTLHNANKDGLKRLFEYADEASVDDTELADAAGISVDELRSIRESLNSHPPAG